MSHDHADHSHHMHHHPVMNASTTAVPLTSTFAPMESHDNHHDHSMHNMDSSANHMGHAMNHMMEMAVSQFQISGQENFHSNQLISHCLLNF